MSAAVVVEGSIPSVSGPSSESTRSCVTCGKPLVRGTGERLEVYAKRLTCSHLCRLYRLMDEGVWQREFPGARHRDWRTVPTQCDDTSNGLGECGGMLIPTDTGVRCFHCGRNQVIALVLVEQMIYSSRRVSSAVIRERLLQIKTLADRV